ncbi:MAG: PASTA domain-containing protein [Candidatus Sumerlaeaceae bacterium]|nr:PASTA domain-containing protein [Candidatus Sumerlaeaceae bacterium]
MKKRVKKKSQKHQQRRSLFGLFRRQHDTMPSEKPNAPQSDATSIADGDTTERAAGPVDVPAGYRDDLSNSPESAVFIPPPPEQKERPIPTTARLPAITEEELAAAQRAAQSYKEVLAERQQRAKAKRPSERKRVAEVRPRRSEGGLFSFIFSVIGLIIRMAVVIVLVAAIGGFVGYEAVRMYVRTPEVVVPNVKGMKLVDAFDALGQKKLGLLKERVEPNSLVAPGEIIEQKPPPGTKAKQGTVVRVVVSSGRANYIVPDVIGERRENAENKIRGAGLEVGDISYLESETVPRDCVISQNPEPNKGLQQPAPVHLLLSKGPPRTSTATLPSPSPTPNP